MVVLPTGGGKSLCFQAPAIVVGPPKGGPHVRRVQQNSTWGPALAGPTARHDGSRARRLAADLADEGSGRRPARRRRGGVVLEQHAVAARARRGAGERPRGSLPAALRVAGAASSARAARRSVACCSRRVCASSRSTRRTASASGATISGRSTVSSAACATIFRTCRCTPLRQPPPIACAGDIVTELRLQDPLVLVGSFDRPNLTYRVLRRGNLHRQLLDVLARHRDEAGIVYCLSRRDVEALAEWLVERRPSRRALSRRAGRRGAQPPSGSISGRARRHRRGHGGVRDGHRSVERALRRARRSAAIARALPAGVGARWPRRSAGGVRADLLRRRFRPVAPDARVERRVERQRQNAAARHGALRGVDAVPAPHAGRVLRPAVRS